MLMQVERIVGTDLFAEKPGIADAPAAAIAAVIAKAAEPRLRSVWRSPTFYAGIVLMIVILAATALVRTALAVSKRFSG